MNIRSSQIQDIVINHIFRALCLKDENAMAMYELRLVAWRTPRFVAEYSHPAPDIEIEKWSKTSRSGASYLRRA